MYKVENLLILVIKHFIFTCKYNSTKKLNIDALLNVITERIYVEKYLLLRNTPSMKNTGKKIVTFLIIREQSHTRNLYFDLVFFN